MLRARYMGPYHIAIMLPNAKSRATAASWTQNGIMTNRFRNWSVRILPRKMFIVFHFVIQQLVGADQIWIALTNARIFLPKPTGVKTLKICRRALGEVVQPIRKV